MANVKSKSTRSRLTFCSVYSNTAHGMLEWLPGKSVGLSASCYPALIQGDVPLFYPFIVDDPGEGTQAKRRAHACVIDHLVPPMTKAETYDELAKLQRLLGEYAAAERIDPDKAPLIAGAIRHSVVAADLQRGPGVHELRGGEPLGDAAHQYYATLIDKLDADKLHVEHIQDFWGDPLTASGAQSADGKAAYVQVYLAGNQGQTLANESVQAVRDTGSYPTKIKVSDEELAAVHLTPHAFHGEWNYTISPAAPAV